MALMGYHTHDIILGTWYFERTHQGVSLSQIKYFTYKRVYYMNYNNIVVFLSISATKLTCKYGMLSKTLFYQLQQKASNYDVIF